MLHVETARVGVDAVSDGIDRSVASGHGGVSIRSVTKRYGSVTAVDELSLEITPGSFVAILGPSGSGKTTLLNLLAGFLDPDEGSITIAGKPMDRCPPHERGVGVVFQQYALFPHMTVEENIAFPLQMRGMPRGQIRQKVDAATEMVELSALRSRSPAQLSGGQQQRVALARALVYEPPVLLLDEPLGALDRRLRDAMQMELKDLHQRVGTTFVYVTHDQEEALSLADTLVVMRDGRIEQCGRPNDVYDRPRTVFVAEFVGDCNVLPGTTEVLAEEVVVRDQATGSVLHRGPNGGSAPIASTAMVAVRPEWFSVCPGDHPVGSHLCAIDAAVVQQRFLGRELIARCETALGDLLVRLPRSSQSERVDLTEVATTTEHGRTMRLTWDPRLTVIVGGQL